MEHNLPPVAGLIPAVPAGAAAEPTIIDPMEAAHHTLKSARRTLAGWAHRTEAWFARHRSSVDIARLESEQARARLQMYSTIGMH